MAGTVTVAEPNEQRGMRKIQWDWLSDASGDADKATTHPYTGILTRVVFDPDAGGTQPTADYDVTITDADGYDVLHGEGADLSNAANVYKDATDGLGSILGSKLTLVVANAGNAKGGKVTVYIG